MHSGDKPHAGTTINCSCFQTTYYEYLKTYFPEFQDKTGIKVNFTMQAFPRLQPAHRPRALDQGLGDRRLQHHLHLFRPLDRRAGWFTPLDPFLERQQVHAGRLGPSTTS